MNNTFLTDNNKNTKITKQYNMDDKYFNVKQLSITFNQGNDL